jgi:TonB family protein
MLTTLFIAATMLFGNPTDANTTTDTQTTVSYEKASFNNDFAEWVNDRLVYPTQARLNHIEGTVYVVFTVDELGNVTNVKIDKSVNKDLDEEALRVITLSPRWKPAKQNGQTIESSYRMGIKFKLS